MTDVDASVYMTAAQIADRDGISRQAVSKQVARLVMRHQLEVKRDGSGRIVAINSAHFDRLLNRFGDTAQMRRKPQAQPVADIESAAGGAPREAKADTLDQARIRKLAYDTELQRLALDEMRGRLVRRDLLDVALQRLSDELARAVDFTQHADPLAAALARGGMHALRIECKRITTVTRTQLADQCARLAIAAPMTDMPAEAQDDTAALA